MLIMCSIPVTVTQPTHLEFCEYLSASGWRWPSPSGLPLAPFPLSFLPLQPTRRRIHFNFPPSKCSSWPASSELSSLQQPSSPSLTHPSVSSRQYFSSVYTGGDGNPVTFVNGSPDQATPSAAYSIPATSKCTTTSSIGNGIASLAQTASTMSSSATKEAAHTGSGGSSGSSSGSSSGGASGASSLQLPITFLAIAGSLIGAAAIL